MKSEKQTQRRRYTPEIRRSMLLDKAAEIINSEGISSLTMERISSNADISKSLMYKYFDSLTELMRELLKRELQSLRRIQAEAAETATTFEGLVRNITHQYLAYIEERGMIIQRLQAEPSVSGVNDSPDEGRTAAVDYLAGIVAKHLDLPLDIAKAATEISLGIPTSAAEYLLRGDLPREQVEDITVSMIIGSITTARNDYLTRRRILSR